MYAEPVLQISSKSTIPFNSLDNDGSTPKKYAGKFVPTTFVGRTDDPGKLFLKTRYQVARGQLHLLYSLGTVVLNPFFCCLSPFPDSYQLSSNCWVTDDICRTCKARVSLTGQPSKRKYDTGHIKTKSQA